MNCKGRPRPTDTFKVHFPSDASTVHKYRTDARDNNTLHTRRPQPLLLLLLPNNVDQGSRAVCDFDSWQPGRQAGTWCRVLKWEPTILISRWFSVVSLARSSAGWWWIFHTWRDHLFSIKHNVCWVLCAVGGPVYGCDFEWIVDLSDGSVVGVSVRRWRTLRRSFIGLYLARDRRRAEYVVVFS